MRLRKFQDDLSALHFPSYNLPLLRPSNQPRLSRLSPFCARQERVEEDDGWTAKLVVRPLRKDKRLDGLGGLVRPQARGGVERRREEVTAVGSEGDMGAVKTRRKWGRRSLSSGCRSRATAGKEVETHIGTETSWTSVLRHWPVAVSHMRL